MSKAPLSIAIVTFLLLTAVFTLQAQPADPQGNPDIVPITGLEYLLIGGGAYGIYRLRKRNQDQPK